jgi:hypothetical protein
MRRVLLRARARAPEMMFAKKKSSPSNPSPDEKSSSRLCKTTNARKNRKTRLEKSDHKTTTRRTFSTLKDDAFTGTFATTLFVCDFCIRIVGATTFAEEATAYMMMMMMMFLFLTCVCVIMTDLLKEGQKGRIILFFFRAVFE